jgi:hypothetical protein
MSNGFIGELAMSIIREILDYVNVEKYNDETHKKYLNIVSLVGEDSIRIKLQQMLDALSEKQKNSKENLAELKLKLSLLEAEIRKIEKNND